MQLFAIVLLLLIAFNPDKKMDLVGVFSFTVSDDLRAGTVNKNEN